MSTRHIKERVLQRFLERNKEKNDKENLEKQLDTIVDDILLKKNISESSHDDSVESDENLKLTVKESTNKNFYYYPYYYIDYNVDSIECAKKYNYNTLKVDRDGLSKNDMDKISSGELINLNKYHVIINCWRVLTKSNIGTYSFDTEKYEPKKFKVKLETTIKWGSKFHIKEKLTKTEQENYSLFRDGVPEFLKSLHDSNVKIFIVSNSHYSFIKSIFEYYKLDKYIEEYFTPSKCGIPQGKYLSQCDSFKDGRKINKERMFACIERYIGRQPKN